MTREAGEVSLRLPLAYEQVFLQVFRERSAHPEPLPTALQLSSEPLNSRETSELNLLHHPSSASPSRPSASMPTATLSPPLLWSTPLSSSSSPEPYLLLTSPRFPSSHAIHLTPIRLSDGSQLAHIYNQPDIGLRMFKTPYPSVTIQFQPLPALQEPLRVD